MNYAQITLLCMGLALTVNHSLAAAPATQCVAPSEFQWTSQHFDGEDFSFWTGVAGDLVIKARSKAQPKLERAQTASAKLLAGAPTCMYDAVTEDGQPFTAKAVFGGSK